jgi:hypothetical protein
MDLESIKVYPMNILRIKKKLTSLKNEVNAHRENIIESPCNLLFSASQLGDFGDLRSRILWLTY